MAPETTQFFEFPTPYSHDRIKEILVFTILEKTLCDMGIYHKVVSELEKMYNSRLFDCYKNPQYLITVLAKSQPESYREAMQTINKQLEMFSDEVPIARFLEAINC